GGCTGARQRTSTRPSCCSCARTTVGARSGSAVSPPPGVPPEGSSDAPVAGAVGSPPPGCSPEPVGRSVASGVEPPDGVAPGSTDGGSGCWTWIGSCVGGVTGVLGPDTEIGGSGCCSSPG